MNDVLIDETLPPPDADSFDPELGRLLEQITARLIAGECLDLETLAREHREHAESLRALVPAMAAVAGLAQPELDPLLPLPPGEGGVRGTGEGSSPENKTLGDFRILREIGRGGMGVVYEAEQLSLGRRVALKVLPFAAMLDERQLARFKNEARAAATLQHANIVPVYAVGCERGVHFYAMQLVEGRSMAEVLAALRGESSQPVGQAVPDECSSHLAPPGLSLSKPRQETSPQCSHLAPRDETSASSPCLPVSLSPSLSPSATGSASADNSLTTDHRLLTPLAPDTVAAALPTRADSASQSGDIRKSKYIHSVANLAIQAANALDHAHTLGIVHRDIKPANLLLECKPLAPRSGAIPARRDASCATGSASVAAPLTTDHRPPTTGPLRLWVTDFGLARIQADAGMTMTGDLVGTLRYMSPEQALAQRVVVDHRTDIYSLGVTLYELLTLQPAFDGTDRQEVLRKIAFDEPAPPRKLNPAIPQDLETIVLKAIAKSPDERYASARDLADDLQRFLDQKTIKARRPTVAQRFTKWTRRHHAFVLASAVVGAVLLTGLAIGFALISSAYKGESQQRELAEERATLANNNLNAALKAVESIACNVQQPDLHRQPGAKAVLTNQLAGAKGLLNDLRLASDADFRIQKTIAMLYYNLAVLHMNWGQWEQAEQTFQEGVLALEKFVVQEPNIQEHRAALALMQIGVAYARNHLGNNDSLELAHRAMESFKSLDTEAVAIEHIISIKHYADVLKQQGHFKEATRAYELLRELIERANGHLSGVEKARRVKLLSSSYFHLGDLASITNDSQKAAGYFRRALELDKSDVSLRLNLQNVLRGLGSYDEARDLVLETQGLLEKLIIADPASPALPTMVASSYWDLGKIERAAQRLPEAEEALKTSWRHWQSLSDKQAIEPDRCWLPHFTAEELAELLELSDRPIEALKVYDDQFALWQQQLKHLPRDKYRKWAGAAENNRGMLLLRMNRSDEARAAFQAAENFFRQAKTDGDSLAVFLANCPDPRLRRPEEALDIARNLVAQDAGNGKFQQALGAAEYRTGNYQTARNALRKAEQSKSKFAPTTLMLVLAEQKLGSHQKALKECRRLIGSYSPSQSYVADHKATEFILEEIRQSLDLSAGDELITPPWRKPSQKAEAAPAISAADANGAGH